MPRYLLCLLFLIVSQLMIAEDCWEPRAPQLTRQDSFFPKKDPPPSLIQEIYQIYQSTSSKNTIHRCLFYTSCSHFALEAIQKYGMFEGTLRFLDRYLYRENLLAYNFYTLKRNPEGIYKIDDDFFLEK